MNPTQNTHTDDVIGSDRVQGTAVYSTAGDKLGSIDGLMINKLSGQVRYAGLEIGGFLGNGTDRYPLPWSMLQYDIKLGGYVVPLTQEKLEQAPRYAKTDSPAYTDEYGRRVSSFFGVDF